MIRFRQLTTTFCMLLTLLSTVTIYGSTEHNTETPSSCGITATISNYSCNDMGTTDPSDDRFSFDLLVTGGPGSHFQVPTIDNGWKEYGVPITYDDNLLPSPLFYIVNGSYTLTIQDAGDNSCTTTAQVTPPPSCSPVCPWQPGYDTGDVSATITRDDNGTPGDPTDDSVSGMFTLNVPSNGDWGVDVKHPVDDSHYIIYGPFSDSQTSTAWGPVDVDIFLANNQNGLVLWYMMDGYTDCLADLWVPFPEPAPSCSISANPGQAVCDDNGTPSDPSDDTYTFDVTVTGTNTGSGWSGNGVSGSYNTPVSFGPYPISGGGQSFVITDNSDGTCMTSTINVSAPATCSNTPPCSISVSAGQAVCDDNGTPSDPSDDTYTFDVTVTGTNTGSGWSGNGMSGSYNTPVTFGPYPINGGGQTFNVTDNTDGTCVSNTVSVSAPATCSNTPPCSISASASQAVCNDNGTPSNPNDDTYTFDVFVSGTSTSSTWFGNGISGGYNTTTTFGPYPINGGGQTFNIVDSADGNCFSNTINVAAPASCSNTPPCTISATISNYQCDDRGTTDPSDDYFSYDLVVTGGSSGSWVSPTIDGTWRSYNTVYNFNSTTLPSPLFQISNGAYILNIMDAVETTCNTGNSIVVSPPASCSPTCPWQSGYDTGDVTSTITRDDNGTPNDPTDDKVSGVFTLLVPSNGAWGLDVKHPVSETPLYIYGPFSGAQTSYAWGPVDVDIFLNNGQNGLVLWYMMDGYTDCLADLWVPFPDPAPGCNISASASNPICNDNGTPTNPNDDTYTFNVTVSGSNTGSGWTGNGVSGSYGTAVTFGPYPISGGGQSFVITDNADGSCVTNTISVSAPATCSNGSTCSISISASAAVCNDNGTPSNPNDDTYTFTVTATGSGTGSGWFGNNTSGAYNTPVTMGPYPISGGAQTFNVTDNDDASCTSNTITVAAPATCSTTSPCSVSISASAAVCNDNGTPNNPNDDTYTFTVTATGSGTGSGWFGNNTSGAYNTPVTMGPYLISGGAQTFNVTDNDDASCTSNTITVAAPATCSNSSSCNISISASTAICNDNGTPDPNDDTYTFEVTATGTGIGTGWFGNETSGAYNTPVTMGPYPISGGSQTFNVTDNVDGSCVSNTITVLAPAACSDTPTCDMTLAINGSYVCERNSGFASVSATNTTGTVSYQWSNGATTASISNLTTGFYAVTVTDDVCSKATAVFVTQPIGGCVENTCNFTATPSASYDCKTGTGTAGVKAEAKDLTYSWSNGATTASQTGLAPGTYSITVTNSARCNVVYTFNISPETNEVYAQIMGDNTTVGYETETFVTPEVTDATYEWTVDGGVGSSTSSSVDVYWTSVGNKNICVTVTTADGCSATNCHTVVINTLPVELTRFTATPIEKAVQLRWSTASEENNDYFSVEHSADGKLFRVIGLVEGNGSTVETQNYEFIHNNPQFGSNFYRLKQVDFDGAFEYSDVLVVDFNQELRHQLKVYPNPVLENGAFTIKINSREYKGNTQVSVFDTYGQRLHFETIEVLEGANSIRLNAGQFPSGMLFIQVEFENGKMISDKVIRQE